MRLWWALLLQSRNFKWVRNLTFQKKQMAVAPAKVHEMYAFALFDIFRYTQRRFLNACEATHRSIEAEKNKVMIVTK